MPRLHGLAHLAVLLVYIPGFAGAPHPAAAGAAQTPDVVVCVFTDGFESGGVCTWTLELGATVESCDVCGDGVLRPASEQCDDGNGVGGDGCSALCELEFCGNGTTDSLVGEQCDDGNDVDTDGCRNHCRLPLCGDGVASDSEACDAGGNSAACDFNCTTASCGDGLLNLVAGEACDDGNAVDTDACLNSCVLASCGDGVVASNSAEQCDDGNAVDTDACRNNCQPPVCGDGVDSTGEACDTGGNSATCDYNCTLPACGDGLTNPAAGEQCDDGGTTSGNGCSATCQLEAP